MHIFNRQTDSNSDYYSQYTANKCNAAGMPFGFGGIARIGGGDLPSDYILGEHARLGSQSVILSRTFKGVVGVDTNAHAIDLKEEVNKVRKRIEEVNVWSEAEHKANKKRIVEAVDNVLYKIRNR